MSKDFQNPILKPEMVTIPKWEYAALISKSTTLEILQKMIKSDKKYAAADLMELLMKEDTE